MQVGWARVTHAHSRGARDPKTIRHIFGQASDFAEIFSTPVAAEGTTRLGKTPPTAPHDRPLEPRRHLTLPVPGQPFPWDAPAHMDHLLVDPEPVAWADGRRRAGQEVDQVGSRDDCHCTCSGVSARIAGRQDLFGVIAEPDPPIAGLRRVVRPAGSRPHLLQRLQPVVRRARAFGTGILGRHLFQRFVRGSLLAGLELIIGNREDCTHYWPHKLDSGAAQSLAPSGRVSLPS